MTITSNSSNKLNYRWVYTLLAIPIAFTVSSGANAASSIKLSATKLAFGTRALKLSTEKQIIITSNGTVALKVGTLAIGGLAKKDYQLTSNTCNGKTLASKTTCKFNVKFTPTVTGARNAEVVIPSNTGSVAKVKLNGSGLSSNPLETNVESNVVIKWDNATLAAIRETHPGPPIVARALAITHTCIYDAWAAYDKKANGTRLGGKLRRPIIEHTQTKKNQAISYAAHECLSDLFPTKVAMFNALMVKLGYNPTDNSTDTATPTGIGNVAAKAVINFRHNDGSNQLGNLKAGAYSDYTGYAPVNTPIKVTNPNHWQPLKIGAATQKFITPHWGKVIPYSLTSGSQFRSVLPKPADYYKEPKRYLDQAEEVLGTSSGLSDDKKVKAEYWADGPHSELPPGHWALIASNCVSKRDKHTLDQDVKMFFAMTNAVFDASIVGWDAKRYFDYVRPITAIHLLFAGEQVDSWQGFVDGADWEPYQASTIVTPPFSEYISGHSIFSAAAAESLKSFTNSDSLKCHDIIKAGSSHVEPGVVPANDTLLYWATFTEAADEAGISRRYGGIHFADGDLEARKIGRAIGKQAWKKSQGLFNGTILSGTLKTLVNDTFDTAFNATVWKKISASKGENVVGKTTRVHDGYLDMRMDETDNGGAAVTRFVPQKKLKIVFKHNMHPGNAYFFPTIEIESGVGTYIAVLDWLRSSYQPDYCSVTGNYDKIRLRTDTTASWCNSTVFSSVASSSFYDKWTTASLTYDMDTGSIEIDLDNDGTVDMQKTIPVASRKAATGVALHAFGWYAGTHSHYVDSIKIDGITAQSETTGIVYIQIDKSDTSTDGDDLFKELKQSSINVASGIERIQSTRMPKVTQVRYFNDGDKDKAERIQTILKRTRPDTALVRLDLPAPNGQLEIWLTKN